MPTPRHGLRHHPHLAAGLKHGGYTTMPEDLSSCAPVLLGPAWVTPKSPAQRGTAGPYPPGAGKPQGKSLSPYPLLRAWVTIALLRACFPGTHKSTQWHRCPRVGSLVCRTMLLAPCTMDSVTPSYLSVANSSHILFTQQCYATKKQCFIP